MTLYSDGSVSSSLTITSTTHRRPFVAKLKNNAPDEGGGWTVRIESVDDRLQAVKENSSGERWIELIANNDEVMW